MEWRDALAERVELEDELIRYLARGRSRWPQLAVAEDALLTHLAQRLPTELLSLDDIHAEDMLLACACASADPAAVAAFQREYSPTIRRAVSKLAPPQQIDELAQSVTATLLAGAPPAIAKYGGRGKLKVWVQVLATRHVGRKLRRKRPDTPNRDDMLADRVAGSDPELDILKHRYSEHFRRALEAALASLQPRDRNMLRHELLDRLSLEKTAAQYGVHRATAARWRAAARGSLLVCVRRYFQQHHGVTDGELDSIVRLIRSQLQLSLTRLLGTSADG